MSTTPLYAGVPTPAPPTRVASSRPGPAITDARITFAGVVRGELLRLRSLPSMRIVAVCIVVVTLGFTFLGGPGSIPVSAPPPELDVMPTTIAGEQPLKLLLTLVGVLFITPEASSGGLRASYLAAPRRLPVLLAKAVVIAVVTFVGMLALLAVSFTLGAAVFSAIGPSEWSALLSGAGLLAIVGGALYYALVALFGLALGALFRSTPAAIAVSVVVMLILPAFWLSLGDLDLSWLWNSMLGKNGHLLFAPASPSEFGLGLLVDVGTVALLLGLGGARLQRSDA